MPENTVLLQVIFEADMEVTRAADIPADTGDSAPTETTIEGQE